MCFILSLFFLSNILYLVNNDMSIQNEWLGFGSKSHLGATRVSFTPRSKISHIFLEYILSYRGGQQIKKDGFKTPTKLNCK